MSRYTDPNESIRVLDSVLQSAAFGEKVRQMIGPLRSHGETPEDAVLNILKDYTRAIRFFKKYGKELINETASHPVSGAVYRILQVKDVLEG